MILDWIALSYVLDVLDVQKQMIYRTRDDSFESEMNSVTS